MDSLYYIPIGIAVATLVCAIVVGCLSSGAGYGFGVLLGGGIATVIACIVISAVLDTQQDDRDRAIGVRIASQQNIPVDYYGEGYFRAIAPCAVTLRVDGDRLIINQSGEPATRAALETLCEGK